MFEDETQVAWLAMPYRATVVAADGSEIGTAESLLGDENEDIFHGIVVKDRKGGKHLEIPAARIMKITEKHVVTDLTDSDVAELQPYREAQWFHVGWGGLFRKHPEWDKTSRS
ncbi:MAG: PRC-barrel domain-containing protein [Candidatus Dormibacteraeota bacterium]|nr:PRC-barrel domain-containing protein [Candidatus Dormibacteraeota bacterium]